MSFFREGSIPSDVSAGQKVRVRVRVKRKKYDEDGNEIPHTHDRSDARVLLHSNGVVACDALIPETNSCVSVQPATTSALTAMPIEGEKRYKQPSERLLKKRKKKNTVKSVQPQTEDPEFEEFDSVEAVNVKQFSKFIGPGRFDTAAGTVSTIDTQETGYETFETAADKTAQPRTDQSFTSFVGTAAAKDTTSTEEGTADVKPFYDRSALKDPFRELEGEDFNGLYPQSRRIPTHSFDSSDLVDSFAWIKNKEISSISNIDVEDDGLFNPIFDDNRLSKKAYKNMGLIQPKDEIQTPTSDPDIFSSDTIAHEPHVKIIQQITEEEEIIEVFNSQTTTDTDTTDTNDNNQAGPQKKSSIASRGLASSNKSNQLTDSEVFKSSYNSRNANSKRSRKSISPMLMDSLTPPIASTDDTFLSNDRHHSSKNSIRNGTQTTMTSVTELVTATLGTAEFVEASGDKGKLFVEINDDNKSSRKSISSKASNRSGKVEPSSEYSEEEEDSYEEEQEESEEEDRFEHLSDEVSFVSNLTEVDV